MEITSGGVRNDHNFLVFGPILKIFGSEAQLTPRTTPNEYDLAMTIFLGSGSIGDNGLWYHHIRIFCNFHIFHPILIEFGREA